VPLDDGGFIRIDARCRVLDEDGALVPGLFAVGDVTAESSYTHSANYQARIIAAHVAGQARDAELAPAVRARLEIALLAQHVRAFPTWSEAIYPAVCSLAAELS
jgi:hypothetical protein